MRPDTLDATDVTANCSPGKGDWVVPKVGLIVTTPGPKGGVIVETGPGVTVAPAPVMPPERGLKEQSGL